MSEFSNNIRIIVGADKLEADVKALADKVALLSQTGTAYQTSSGTVTAATGLTAKEVQNLADVLGGAKSGVKKGEEDEEDEEDKDDEDKDATNNGGGSPGNSTQLGNDVLDGVFAGIREELGSGDYDIEGLLSEDGSGGPPIGSQAVLRGIQTAFNREGLPLTLREDGLVVPGENRQSINSPAEISDFYPGQTFPKYNLDGTYVNTSSMRESLTSQFRRLFEQGSGYDAGNRYALGDVSAETVGDHLTITGTVAQIVDEGEPILNPIYDGNIQVSSEVCTPGSSASCPLTAPTPEPWLGGPGVVLYKQLNGTMAPTAQDIKSSYTYGGLYNGEYGSSTISGVFYRDGVQKFFKRTPTKDGGFMYGEITGLDGIAQKYIEDKYVHVFDSQGRQKAVVRGVDAKVYVRVSGDAI